jgi:hypothetical protein
VNPFTTGIGSGVPYGKGLVLLPVDPTGFAATSRIR